MSQAGTPWLFNGVIVNRDYAKSNPDLVKRFVRATLKSYMWTRDNMEKAVAEIVKVSPDRDLKLETQKLGIIYGLYNVPDYAERFGLMNDDKWQSSIDILASSGDLPKKPSAKEMYTNAIVESLDEARSVVDAMKHPGYRCLGYLQLHDALPASRRADNKTRRRSG